MLLDLSTARQTVLLHSAPAAVESEAAATGWDRAYARCLLELAAAVSALQPHTLGCRRRRHVKRLRPNTARERAVAALQQLTNSRFVRLCGLGSMASSSCHRSGTTGAARQLTEQGVLAALARRLRSPTSRSVLPPLLERLLPPGEKAAGEAAAPLAVPAAAAVFQAHALAHRACGNLLCSSLAGIGAELPRLHGRRCAGCRVVRYCSLGCQVADWQSHKPACRALAAAASEL
ncbi:hypothetical protein ABPG75_010677 [Micractinium tetrahymenae]